MEFNLIIKLLQDTYNTNEKILHNQDEEHLQTSREMFELYQAYWISNAKIKNIIDLIHTHLPSNLR